MEKSSSEQNWYIFYTCPRAEKVVQQELLNRNYDVFLPVTKVLRFWKNRQKKWIDQVLFPNYIFVKTRLIDLYHISQIPKVVSCINCSGKPSIISSKELECIKKMLKSGNELTIETNFTKGERVEIVSGPLIGNEGILVEQKGKTRFGIQLKEIRHTILIDVNMNQLKKI
jgi:transcription antitermination factor NusG